MIDEQKLAEWASAPEATKYKHTHEKIREALSTYLPDQALSKNSFKLADGDYDVYLQGSYANSTNIKIDSDVDVVIELKTIFSYDLDNLTLDEKQEFHSVYPNMVEYTFKRFKDDVFQSLKLFFGDENVEYSKKCLKIKGNSLRVDADVVPSFEHRKFERFTFYTRDKFIPGIKFYNTETDEKIINYPKKHKENCEALNKDTEGKFKDAIRIFKHFNRELKEKDIIDENIAPSYFIENMIYNCSAQTFNGSYSDIILKLFQYLSNDIDSGRFQLYQCANEQDLLFADKTWEYKKALIFISKSADLFFEKI
jgi:predicted nucleotidyltransferase